MCGVGAVNPGNFIAWHERVPSLEASAAFVERRVALAGAGADPIAAQARFATAEIFKVLGAHPALGRFYSADEDKPGGPNVLVLSHALWQQHFGGDPGIVEPACTDERNEYTVIGVTAPRFGLYDPVDVWRSDPLWPGQPHGARSDFSVPIGLLKPGASIDQAQDRRVKRVALERHGVPEFNTNMTALARRCARNWSAIRRALWTLLAAVGSCSSSRARTSQTCSSRARRTASVKWRFASRSARRRGGWCGKCSPRSVLLAGDRRGHRPLLAVKGNGVLVALVPSGISTAQVLRTCRWTGAC